MDLANAAPAPTMDDELTPAARAALMAARAEADALRAELARLQRRLDEVELLADRDPLTPVLNRRAFTREMARTIAFCERYEAPASLAFFDLDGFKAVNDQFGHAAGDAALQVVAGILADHVRESDVVGRLGGDEFAVILAQAGREAAETKAADLQRRIEADPVVFEGRAIPLRVSFGVRTFEAGASAAQVLAEADAAMFLRKGERRRG
jgi:diguanylate cyclase (GGDEF)-like protein